MTFVRLYIALLIYCLACTVFAIWCMFTNPAHAGDNAPGAHLWPPAQTYAVSIPMGELPSCTVLRDCCGVHRECGDYYERAPDPAPVPLPPTLLLLTAAIAALIWKGSYRV
jgi:hypothetical protein